MKSEISVFKDHEFGTLTIEKVENLVFLHLVAHRWGKDTLKFFREELEKVLLHFKELKYDVVFVYANEQQTTKFWQLVKPCYTLQSLDGRGYLGSWLTEEI